MTDFDEVIKGYSDEEEAPKDKRFVILEAVMIAVVLLMLLGFSILVLSAIISGLVWFIVEAWRTILG